MNYWDYTGGGDYLSHHGIEGQKWGVRHGPPYPIDHTKMSKGTKLSNVVAVGNNGGPNFGLAYDNSEDFRKVVGDSYLKSAGMKNNLMYTYNKKDKEDREVYEGPFAQYAASRKANDSVINVISTTYETTKDLKLADLKTRKDTFKQVYNKNKRVAVKELSGYQKPVTELYRSNYEKALSENRGNGDIDKYSKLYKNVKNLNLNKIKTNDDWDTAYNLFNHAMENAHRMNITKKYIKKISSKYDGMVDDNNVNLYNKAHDPVIIFNPEKNLKYHSGERLGYDTVQKNIEKVRKRNGSVAYSGMEEGEIL